MAQKKRLLGLKGKFLLMVLVPVAITFIVVGVYSRVSLDQFGYQVGQDSTKIVTAFAEKEIMEKARSVAKQIELALQMYPDQKPLELNDNPFIHNLAIQKVGRTGYTVLSSVPPPNSDVSLTLIHPTLDMIGKDAPAFLKKIMKDNYQAWFNIYKGVYGGDESSGYYTMQYPDGTKREKFMALAPVKNTQYFVSATTFLDEFLDPINKLNSDIQAQNKVIGQVHLFTMLVGLILVVCFVMVGIQRISKQIIKLTESISEVSTGKTDNEIEIPRSNDELQDLAEAFERMRTAVKYIMQKIAKQSAQKSEKKPQPDVAGTAS